MWYGWVSWYAGIVYKLSVSEMESIYKFGEVERELFFILIDIKIYITISIRVVQRKVILKQAKSKGCKFFKNYYTH